MKYLYRKNLILFTVFFGLFIVTNNCRTVDADERQLKIESVKIGIEGRYKNGLWTQANIRCSIPDSKSSNEKIDSLSIDSIDSDGSPITYRKKFSDIEIKNVTNLSSVIYFKTGRHNAKVTVKIESTTGKILDSVTLSPSDNLSLQKNSSEFLYDNSSGNFVFLPPIPTERQIILVIGNEDIGLQSAIAELALREERRPLIVKINSIADLPDQWNGYESIDMIVLTTTEPEQFENLNANSSQILAIEQWIKLGGRMLFCAGRNSELLLKKKNESDPYDAPLTPFLPGKFEKMTNLRKGDLLETFVLSKRKIQIESANDFIVMPLISNPKGLIRLNDGDLPIVSHRLHGFGTITYFGGDLSGKPLGNWRDKTALVKKILQWDTSKQSISQQDMSLIRPAYNDMSGQIRSAADHFDEIKIIPFSAILIILVVYWLAIGIADWFIVRKLLKRPMLAWITFPFWILIFCVIGYVIVIQCRPSGAILRELVVVDLNPEQNEFRCSIWGNLYSPLDARYSLGLTKNKNLYDKNTTQNISVTKNIHDDNKSNSVEINSASNLVTSNISKSNQTIENEVVFFSWLGLSGDGLGGMNPKTFNPMIWRIGSIQEKPEEIQNVPIQIRSTKSFYGERFGVTKNMKSIKSKLLADEGLPVGELLFDDVPALKDAALVYGRWLIPLGNTPNRGKIIIDKKSQRRDIGDILLSKIAMDNDSLRLISTYNTQSVDEAYIVKVLTVHERLGGYETIGLFNNFQRPLDMSNILSTNHAIIIGEFESDQISPDNINVSIPVTRHTKTIMRQILPVTPTAARTILSPDKLEEKIEPTIKSPTEKDFKNL
ncbi:MAG: hypothetical protein LBB88_01410 [Planctomycetaceae bacterium]|jgi:hypothetical protein|nr:hypothetical protein [Planctomycetaceae bacterium]